MPASTPKTALRAGFLLFPAIILAAAPAVASSPRCDEPPAPACERVQAVERAELALLWVEKAKVPTPAIALLPPMDGLPAVVNLEVQVDWTERDLAELEWAELEWAELELAGPDWSDLEAHVAPILEASLSQQALGIERAKEVSRHLARKVKERLERTKPDTAHPLNPGIQALVSIAKVPARGVAPLRQALAGVAKAVSHVLQALLV